MATEANAITIRDRIKSGIYQGRPEHKKLSPLTVSIKGSSKPLFDHGDLIKSVDVAPAGPGVYFVGVRRGVKNPYGVEMVNIARVHEYGVPEGIVPKRAKALTIPASRQAAEAARKAGSVRDIPGLFMLKTKGKSIGVLAKKKGRSFEVWFFLRKKIIIPARPFIFPGIRDAQRLCRARWQQCMKATIALFTDITQAVRDYLASKFDAIYIKTAYGDIGENLDHVPAIVISLGGIARDLTRRLSGPTRVVSIVPVGESYRADLRAVPVPINIEYQFDTRTPKRFMDFPLAERLAWLLEQPERETFISESGRILYLAPVVTPFDGADALLNDFWHKVFRCYVPTWLRDPADIVETAGVLQTRILDMEGNRYIKQEGS
jgi:hypothetical protein